MAIYVREIFDSRAIDMRGKHNSYTFTVLSLNIMLFDNDSSAINYQLHIDKRKNGREMNKSLNLNGRLSIMVVENESINYTRIVLRDRARFVRAIEAHANYFSVFYFILRTYICALNYF